MKTIWKYELETIDQNKIEMPIKAEILTVQIQHGTPCLWVLVDPDLDPNNDKETRYFEVHGTGHIIRDDIVSTRNYIGTYQLNGGALIFHVFEYTGI